MAFTLKGLEMIATIPKLRKVVSYGYPIILQKPEMIEAMFNVKLDNSDMISPAYAKRIKRIHGKNQSYFVDTASLFKKIGAEFHAIDIVNPYNCEIYHDLNNDIPDELMAKVGNACLSIDPGTLEHIFYAGKAFTNLYKMTKVNGNILHVSAPISPNHGLWNPQEKLFLRFYMANKANILLAEKYFTDKPKELIPLSGKRWYLNKHSELHTTVFVQKTHDGEVTLPTDYLT